MNSSNFSKGWLAGLVGAVLVAVALLCSSCTWERAAKISHAGIYAATTAIDSAGIPAVHEAAMSEAGKCAAAKSATCPAKDKLQVVRHKMEAVARGIYLTLGLASAAIAIGDEAGATGMIAKALALVGDLKSLVLASEVIP